jgi:hypothetical protein
LPEAQQTALVGELAGLGTKDPDAITAYLTQRLDEITRAAPPVIEATPPPPSLAVATAAAPVPALQADNRQITVLSRNDFSSVVPEKESPYMGMGVPDVPDQGRLPCLDLCPPERNTALIAEMGQFRPQPDLPARAPSRDLGRTGAG